MLKVPQNFQFLLPSSRVSNLDVQKDKTYIIENFLKNSTLEAWKWLLQNYSKNEITEVIKSSKNLRKKDVLIWSLMYNIPTKEILCLRTKSPAGLNSSWAY